MIGMGVAMYEDTCPPEVGKQLGGFRSRKGWDSGKTRGYAVAIADLNETFQRRRRGAGVIVAQPELDSCTLFAPGIKFGGKV
tara:strand:+ start:96 stop:341 length:246 start_codon:yes stop_codon:yes gene_type:complete